MSLTGDGKEFVKICEFYDEEKTKIKFEKWLLDNNLHRIDGPAEIRYYKNGNIYYEIYYVEGEKCRLDDGPIEIYYFENGECHFENYYSQNVFVNILYYDNGMIQSVSYFKIKNKTKKYHSEDGPALILYSRDGNIIYECYYTNGAIHREDGPCIIEYFDNGRIKLKQYYIDCKLHREDGPAVTEYYVDGSISCEKYYLNDVIHHEQENGPSIIHYYENGLVKLEEFYENGKYRNHLNGPSKIHYYDNGKIELETYYCTRENKIKKEVHYENKI